MLRLGLLLTVLLSALSSLSTASAQVPPKKLYEDQLEVPAAAQTVSDDYTLDSDSGGSQGLTILTSSGGYVTSFAYDDQVFRWDPDTSRYNSNSSFEYLEFRKQEPGVYDYTHRVATIPPTTIDTGTATQS